MLTKHVKHWLATMGLLLCSLTTSAYDFEVNGICYNILSDADLTVEVTESNTGYSGDVVIPSTVVYEGITYRVTSIGGYAFAYCSISSVTIPLGVTNIGGHAFYSCSLTSINLPEGVTSIGYSAFCGSDLISITIPNSVTSIEKFTFSVCPNLTTITISGSVKSIDYQAFYLSSLESITCKSVIPPTINHSELSSVDSSIPIYVPALAIEAYKSAECWSEFTNIQAISSNDLASGTCGDNLAWKLTEEYELIIEGTGEMYDFSDFSVETTPWYDYRESITEVTMKEGITSIGDRAFHSCSKLKRIDIPEGVVAIGEYAMCSCNSITSITLPASLTDIDATAFNLSGNIVQFIVDEGNPIFSDYINNAIVDKGTKTLIAGTIHGGIPDDIKHIGDWAFCGRNIEGYFKVPEGVVSIGGWAFASSSVSSIRLPKTLKSFGNYAFQALTMGSSLSEISEVHIDDLAAWLDIEIPWHESNPLCNGASLYLDDKLLESIVVPEGVTTIKKYAFAGWNGKEIVLSKSITEIGENAFYNCFNFTSIIISEGVTNIGWGAFDGCRNLTSVTCEAATPPTIGGSSTFGAVDKSIPIYVPAGSVESYKSAEYWSEFTNIRPITNEYTLTVSSAGYATLYLDYAAEIPDNVKAYIATSVEGDRLMMTRVTGVLPAEIGVIVCAEAGEYTFAESDETPANVEGNLLSGTATDTYIAAESGYKYYVLAKKDGIVAMYHPQLNADGEFLNNANKAYLRLESDDLGIFDDETNTEEEGGQLSNRLRFDFGGTTDIEKTTDNGGQTTVIHDLHGRRIIDTEGLKGVYIVNGSKVIF